MKMPFGRYQGVELNEIPEPYLRWLRSQPWVGGWLVRAVDGVLGDVARWPDEECVCGWARLVLHRVVIGAVDVERGHTS